MEKVLIIVRGLPGSGKSTFAELLGNVQICTADDYFMTSGAYQFKQEDLGAAHLKCQQKCENLMKANTPRIAVANTATTSREIAPYTGLAEKYGYKVFSVVVENRHGGSNVHNVPPETIEKMRGRFDIKL